MKCTSNVGRVGENGGELSDDDWREEIVSNTETVEVLFHTDGSHRYTGWRLQWGKGKVQKTKRKKKLTSVSFMYVCVAGNGEMLVFFPFFPQQ